jgi:hypothetical protein
LRFYSKLRAVETQPEANVTSAQRVRQREKALNAAKKAFLEERTIERLGAVIQAQVDHQEEVSNLQSETQGTGQLQ